jgi:hypothetical protein
VKSLGSALWRCEPNIASLNVELVAWTRVVPLITEDLTPQSYDRKWLRITTLTGDEVLFVSCFIADRVTKVEFLEPTTLASGLRQTTDELMTEILERAMREGLPKREVGFRLARS